MPTITPIREIGDSCRGRIETDYATIIEKVGKPNVTDMDDHDKVPASWGFCDEKGRKAYIWAYGIRKKDVKVNDCWSWDGDYTLLVDLFGNAVRRL